VAGNFGGASFGGSAVPTVAGREDSVVNAEINVTPMVDVMLVLLIIFMVITPALAGYHVTLPKTLTAAPEKEERVTLGIDDQGRYYLDQRPQPVPPAQLTARLRELYATRPEDHVLYLKADRGVEYSVVLTAIDAARAAGVRRVGAITEQAHPATAATQPGG
jgi:biopolymer transport protein ExbD